MQAVPAGESLSHGALEQIGRDAIVIAPVAWFADALDEATLLEETGVDAGAPFARAQLLCDFVEGEVAIRGRPSPSLATANRSTKSLRVHLARPADGWWEALDLWAVIVI